jgi:hypothetical protein
MNPPGYVTKLGVEQQWTSVYHQYENQGSEVAFIAANSWLNNHLSTFTAQSKQVRDVVKFRVELGEDFIKRTDDGEEYITAVLQDVFGDADGVQWTPEVLVKFAEEINRNGIVGDIDHSEYDRILSDALTDEQVRAMLSQKGGIAKAVRAVFQDGKLFIKALIDKRYKKQIQEAKGLSLEAVVTKDLTGRVTDGNILGFTFAVNSEPANPRAVVV